MSTGIYTHYATEVSLYSGKTRAYLRYKSVPFREVTSSARVYREVIIPHVGRPIIPVVETPEGQILQDTTVIIDALEERFGDPSIYPEGPAQRLVALLLEVYGDEWLLMPAMHYRWHYRRENLLFILREFGATVSPGAPRLLHPLLGLPPALVFGTQYQAYLGITPRMWEPLERSYLGFLHDFDRHLEHHPFLLGSRPSIGDFGLIAPLYAHLYRDPAPGRLMRRVAPRVAQWVERMEHPPEPGGGVFLAGDEVPETLEPILRRMFDEQLPVLVDTVRRTHAWALANPGVRRVPRVIGKHTYRLGGGHQATRSPIVEEERKVIPFSQWMFQRPLAHYASLAPDARARIDPLLERLGGLDGLRIDVPTRLAYRNHRLVLE